MDTQEMHDKLDAIARDMYGRDYPGLDDLERENVDREYIAREDDTCYHTFDVCLPFPVALDHVVWDAHNKRYIMQRDQEITYVHTGYTLT